MTAYTDFHYSPTGSGVISGAQVLEQTEQGINGLGQYVQDNVSGAIDTANQALTTAQSADSNATTAINLANSFNAQIIAANQTAGNALTTAQSAQNTANAASSLATTANNNAATALNTANAASAGVTTLTGTVNSLGNRMTAAENAISANAGNITTLQNNLATTNANVTAAANAASAAQATATSAQSTATLARNQAYVLRYTGTTITGGGTIAYADIDNTDNIKAGDKIIDVTGVIYAIASVDTANQSVTVGATEIINLAVLPDLFNSANTWTALNSYNQSIQITANFDIGVAPSSDVYGGFRFGNGTSIIGNVTARVSSAGITYSRLYVSNKYANGALDPNGTLANVELQVGLKANGNRFIYSNASWDNSLIPYANNTYDLGSSSYQWNNIYAKNYYYNGTAWGLDKENVWTNRQTYSTGFYGEMIWLKNTDLDLSVNGNTGLSSTCQHIINWCDKNNTVYSTIQSWTTSLENTLVLRSKYRTDANTVRDLSVRFTSTATNKVIYPETNADIDLGTSTNKWKTLNGINPGALSLPKEEYSDVDISAQGLNWDLTGSSDNSYTPNIDGWLEIWVKRTSLPTAYISVGNAYVRQVSEATVFNFACVTCPVRNGQTYTVRILANECHVRIMKAEGNV